MMAAARTGSVGVRHAAIASAEIKVKAGNSAWMVPVNHEILDVSQYKRGYRSPATTSQPNAIVGIT